MEQWTHLPYREETDNNLVKEYLNTKLSPLDLMLFHSVLIKLNKKQQISQPDLALKQLQKMKCKGVCCSSLMSLYLH